MATGSGRRNGDGRDYWHASQASGFSNEHATALASSAPGAGGADVAGASTVVFAISVAGRDRR